MSTDYKIRNTYIISRVAFVKWSRKILLRTPGILVNFYRINSHT